MSFGDDSPAAGTADLSVELTGTLLPGVSFLRRELLDAVTAAIPKDPELRLLVYHGELRADFAVPWHIHNGPLVNIIIQGEVIFQLPDREYYYKAGDVFIEPVGVPHRAYVPDPDSEITLVAIGMQFTPLHRDHLVPVGDLYPDHPRPRTAPPGPLEPLPTLAEHLPYTEQTHPGTGTA